MINVFSLFGLGGAVCADHADCRAGEFCGGGECMDAGCSDDSECYQNHCPDETCYCCVGHCKYPCTNDSSCAVGETCEEGICRRHCQENADCFEFYGETCDGNMCRRPCDHDIECDGSEFCLNGTCRDCNYEEFLTTYKKHL